MLAPAENHHNPPRRADLAHKHATANQLRSIYFSESLGRWTDGNGPSDLSKTAKRALRFFCALHRAGSVGFVGTRAPLGAVVDAIRRATDDESCSLTTLRRMADELIAKGYLVKSYGYEGTREIEPGVWIRDRIVMFTTTRKARDIWSRTFAHKAPKRPNNDIPDAPYKKSEGSSARAHALEDVDTGRFSNEEPLRGDIAPRDHADAPSPPAAAAVVAVDEPRQSPRPIAPRDERADTNRPEGDSPEPCQRPRVSDRPAGIRPHARRAVAEAILRGLAAVLDVRGDQQAARFVIARAAHELAGGSSSSTIDWGFWIAAWPGMRQREKRWWARRELVPLLSSMPSSSPASTAPSSSCSSSSMPSSSPASTAPSSSCSSSSMPSSSPDLEHDVDPANPFAAHYLRIVKKLEK